MNLKTYFDAVYILNLKRRPDRLKQIKAEMKKADWPFKEPEIVWGVDGYVTPHTEGWKGGGGAYGCNRGHLRILEMAMTDKHKQVLVLEDDCFFVPDFADKVEEFLNKVPDDWQQLMIGGQHLSPSQLISKGLVKCKNCQRTHAYGIRNGNFMKDLYKEWLVFPSHIDHRMGAIQNKYKVYAPDPFLVGQDESRSDIMCSNLNKRIWSKAPAGLPVILLRCSKEIRDELSDKLHYGYTIDNKLGIDKGLLEASRQANPPKKIKHWCEYVGAEAWLMGKHLAIWCDDLKDEDVLAAYSPVFVIKGETREEVLKQIPENYKAPTPPIVLLRTSKQVAQELSEEGWHRGYWLDGLTGQDNGLRAMMANKKDQALIDGLKDWLTLVGEEAMKIRNGVLVVFHPNLTLDLLRKATDQKIVEISGKTKEECLAQL